MHRLNFKNHADCNSCFFSRNDGNYFSTNAIVFVARLVGKILSRSLEKKSFRAGSTLADEIPHPSLYGAPPRSQRGPGLQSQKAFGAFEEGPAAFRNFKCSQAKRFQGIVRKRACRTSGF